MNIITIDVDKLTKMINEYILNSRTSYMSVSEKFEIERPIILMNEETLNKIKEPLNVLSTIPYSTVSYSKTNKMFQGCHIAIADWLPFGEVLLK